MKVFTCLAGLLAIGQFLLVTAASVHADIAKKASIRDVASSAANSNHLPYPLGVATWTGEVDGVKYEINGSSNTVLAELKLKHPGFDFAARAAALALNDTSASSLNKRGKNWPPLCIPVNGQPWQPAWADEAFPCEQSIRNVGGVFSIGARTCARIACNRRARVIWCNDLSDPTYAAAASLATFVPDICQTCLYREWWYPRGECGGQLFDNFGFNVIVRDTFDDSEAPPVC